MSTDENRTASQGVSTSDDYGRRTRATTTVAVTRAATTVAVTRAATSGTRRTLESPHPVDLLAAQREQYGGTRIGSAFFGWLVAAATTVLLTALLAAAGTAVGAASGTTLAEATSWARADADTLGLVGAVTLAAVLFVAFGCGGYVAGRMARFDGARQGLAVWLWAVVLAIVVAGARTGRRGPGRPAGRGSTPGRSSRCGGATSARRASWLLPRSRRSASSGRSSAGSPGCASTDGSTGCADPTAP